MKFTQLAATLATLGLVTASLISKRAMSSGSGMINGTSSSNSSDPTIETILQYALTLEHLEATFYKEGLMNYTAADFAAAGFPDWVRQRTEEIHSHEESHVLLLTNALSAVGASPNQACNYNFPVSDVKSFLVFACGLENVGESAYLGALGYIKEAAYATIAGSITAVEARHQEFFYGPVLLQSGWTGPYDTPLGLDMVYTLVAPLLGSCPSSNVALPVMSYGPITVNGSEIFNAMGGETVQLSYGNMASGDMAVIYNGLGMTSIPVGSNGMITLPSSIQGYSYVVISSASNGTMVDSSNIKAGPAEIQTSFVPGAFNPGFMDPFSSTPNMTQYN